MDAYYQDYLLFYDTERVIDIKYQKAGIDVIFMLCPSLFMKMNLGYLTPAK